MVDGKSFGVGMFFKRLFEFFMFCFIIFVPLIPGKIKIAIFPVAADFLLGGLCILTGMVYLMLNIRRESSFKVIGDRNIKYLTIVIAFFAILSSGSILYALNKKAVISETLRLMEYVLMFYIILIVADKNFIKKGLKLFYYTMIAASLYGLIQFIFNLSDISVGGYFNRGRVYSTFVNPNYWGAAINLVIFVPIINLLEKRKNIIINIVLLVLFLLNLVLCFTRGSWIGFAFGLLTIFIIRYRKALISIPVLGVIAFIVPFTRGRFLSIFNLSNATSSERIKLWKTGYLMFKDHFLFGVGNGNYLYRYYEYVKKYRYLYLDKKMYSVHNSYLKMFAELGIFGGMFFIFMYGLLFRLSYKVYNMISNYEYKNYALAFLGFWGAYWFQNFFNNLMFIPQLNVFVWIITAMLYKILYIENQEVCYVD